MTKNKVTGASLRDPPSLKARKQEAPYILRALNAKDRGEAREAISSGRSYSDRTRDAVFTSVRGKR